MANKQISKSHKGRKCKYPDCGRVLSIYNHDTHCHVHQDRMWLENGFKEADLTAKKAGDR